jgi:hypothetical protein
MYTIEDIKSECYETFLNKLETQLIINNNVKEIIGNLLSVTRRPPLGGIVPFFRGASRISKCPTFVPHL